MTRRRRKNRRGVSASALSQMGVCERLVVFEHHEGQRLTPARKLTMHRGLRAHRHFASEGAPEAARKGRCFIATHVFGEGPETQVLRCFRDLYLRPTGAGRRVILTYYQLAPSVCRAMDRWPMVRYGVRVALRPLVWFATCLLGEQKASHASS